MLLESLKQLQIEDEQNAEALNKLFGELQGVSEERFLEVVAQLTALLEVQQKTGEEIKTGLKTLDKEFPEEVTVKNPVTEVTIKNPVEEVSIKQPSWFKLPSFAKIEERLDLLLRKPEKDFPKIKDYTEDLNSIKGLLTAILAALLKPQPKSTPLYSKRLGRGTGNPLLAHDLSSSLDGVTKTFTIPTNTAVVSVHSSSTPFSWRPTVDYTTTSTSITFDASVDAASMLAAGQTLILLYY